MTQTILRLRHGPIFGDSIELHLAHRLDDGRIAVADPLHMRVLTPDDQAHSSYQAPLLHLDHDAAQRLIDELWHLGLRPTEGHGSTGQLAATEKHLNHLTRLLDQTLQTTLNVANASLLPSLPVPQSPSL